MDRHERARDAGPLASLMALVVRNNFARKVVNHDWAVKVRNRRIYIILIPYESPPTLGVHRFGFSAGVPEIDSAYRFPVLRQEVILTKKAGYALKFRGSA